MLDPKSAKEFDDIVKQLISEKKIKLKKIK
jgi:hypothetical protein